MLKDQKLRSTAELNLSDSIHSDSSIDELNFPEHWSLTHRALHIKILSVTKYLQIIYTGLIHCLSLQDGRLSSTM